MYKRERKKETKDFGNLGVYEGVTWRRKERGRERLTGFEKKM